MPLVRENSLLYEVIKVSTISGEALQISGNITGTVVTDLQKGSGATTATTARVVIATDSPTVTGISSIDTKTPALQSGAVPVGDNSGSLTVDGKAYRSVATITRPANTTAYTVGDVVGDTGGSAIISLTSAGPSGGFVILQSVSLVFSDSVVPASMGAFRVHLYSVSPTAIADNAAFDLVSGDRDTYMGYIDMPTPLDLGSTLYTQTDYPGRLIKLAAASTTLFVELETRGAYTPVSASTVAIRVNLLEAGL